MKQSGKTMRDFNFVPTLKKTLEELDHLTRNALAVEAKVRPATINDIVAGNSKQINMETLNAIIETLNTISKEKGLDKKYSVSDIFEHSEFLKES
ncbi:helix-turn-helix domain-containing protein [Bacillus velezensis]|uniref:helix-turn-helix domain-containing protein n=1 Tax=Bacillus velezensis TaxID=492670 RepID=UPI0024BBE400|nr:helix-turn-helix transcriptional regulator [Bacillus velezensis]